MSIWTRSSSPSKSCSIPRCKGKPVVVGGQRGQRGVVSAASYAARKFGVHSAMPLRTAARLCPQAIFVDGHPERYRECSRKVFEVLNSFSPQVDMASIDEAYVDVTRHGAAARSAARRRARAARYESRERRGSTAPSGLRRRAWWPKSHPIRPSRTACLWVLPGEEARFLAPLDVRKDSGRREGDREGSCTPAAFAKSEIWRHSRNLFCAERFGQWGMALAGKARGLDAGGWFDGEVGDDAATEIDQP